jgi:porin
MSVSLVDFFSRRSVLSLIVSCCLAAISVHAPAQETGEGTPSGARDGDVVHFGGPNAVGNRIEDDAKPREALVKERALQPWFDWKESLMERSGVSLGLDYSSLFLAADNSAGADDASAGMFRFYGSWEAVGRGTKNSGALVWKVENRHRYGDVAPSGFGIGELGYVGLIGPPWSNQGTRWTNLYWRQRFNEGRATVLGGYLDTTDYVDVWIGADPWTKFTNLVFSTGSASMFLPNDATLGAAGGAMVTGKMYVIGGITNAYADSTDPIDDSFERFFSDNEYFTTLELGWTKSHEQIYFDNTHFTFWHVDDSPKAGAIQGWGLNFSHIQYINDRWMPFVRGGYADDGGSLLQKSLSAGFLYQKTPRKNLLGFGLNWGQPNESTFAPGLDDQITMETFYRFQLTQQFALTPTVQYLKNPALNPIDDSLWVLGLRARLAL